MKILVTGFDPFGGEKVNPSFEAVKNIPDKIGDIEVIKIEIPTVFNKSIKMLLKNIEEYKPDSVICVGQAGRFDITVERIAINVDDARIKDNENNQPIDVKIYEDGSNAYFSNLPIKAMVFEMKKNNIPASVSNTAGTFVCNHLMYGLMYHINKNNVCKLGGFIHVPYIPDQVIGKANHPYMSLDMITKGLIESIKCIYNYKNDIKEIGGLEF